MIRQFVLGRWYICLVQARPPQWIDSGAMDYVMDGRPHQCTSKPNKDPLYAGFDHKEIWCWRNYDFREAQMTEITEINRDYEETQYKLRIERNVNLEEDTANMTLTANKKLQDTLNRFVIKTEKKEEVGRGKSTYNRYLVKKIILNNLKNARTNYLFSCALVDNATITITDVPLANFRDIQNDITTTFKELIMLITQIENVAGITEVVTSTGEVQQ